MRNPYKSLLALMPNPPLLVGDVDSYADGVAIVTLPGGGTVSARGSTAVGARVFVRDGVIEGPAPELTLLTIEV